MNENLNSVEKELGWLGQVIDHRFMTYFKSSSDTPETSDLTSLTPPDADKSTGLGKLISDHNLGATERMILALTLAPSLKPQM